MYDEAFCELLKKPNGKTVLIKALQDMQTFSLVQYAILKDTISNYYYLDYVEAKEEEHVILLSLYKNQVLQREILDLKIYEFTKWLLEKLRKPKKCDIQIVSSVEIDNIKRWENDNQDKYENDNVLLICDENNHNTWHIRAKENFMSTQRIVPDSNLAKFLFAKDISQVKKIEGKDLLNNVMLYLDRSQPENFIKFLLQQFKLLHSISSYFKLHYSDILRKFENEAQKIIPHMIYNKVNDSYLVIKKSNHFSCKFFTILSNYEIFCSDYIDERLKKLIETSYKKTTKDRNFLYLDNKISECINLLKKVWGKQVEKSNRWSELICFRNYCGKIIFFGIIYAYLLSFLTEKMLSTTSKTLLIIVSITLSVIQQHYMFKFVSHKVCKKISKLLKQYYYL